MNNDTSETGIFLIIGIAAAFILLKEFLLSVFITIWKWPMMAFLFPLVYAPSEITNDGIFFWINADIPSVAANYISILSIDSSVIVETEKYNGIVSSVNTFVSTIISPFIFFMFLYFSYKIYAFRDNDYKDKHSIDSLLKHQADLWPQVKPMVNIHPQKIDDLDEGEWAMCLEPFSFAEKNKILIREENKMGEESLRLNDGIATTVFQKQLGRPWKGEDDLDKHERYIYAILISRACRNTDHSLKLVQAIARSLTSETKYSKKELKAFEDIAELEVEEAIQKYKNEEKVQDVIREHFFVTTVMARMLEEARKDGVLATADFVWLKIKNRGLWYILNNIGRRSAWTEAAGIWFHYNYEKAIKRKIPSPMVSGAVSSLDLAFRESSPSYIPLPGHNKNMD